MANHESTLTLPEEAGRHGVQHDLRDARGLIEEADNHSDGKKYRKAAEIVLLKILHADPANEEARTLLQRARNLPEERRAPQPEPVVEPVIEPAIEPVVEHVHSQTFEPVQHSQHSQHSEESEHPQYSEHSEYSEPAQYLEHPQHAQRAEEIPFTAVPLTMPPMKQGRSKVPFILIAAVLLGGVLLKMRWRTGDATARPAQAAQTQTQTQTPSPSNFQPRPVESQSPLSPATPEKSAALLPPPVALPPLTRVETATVNVTTPAENGRLAISSPTATDIFIDGQFVGSTPTTLQLTSGRHTIEYRHGDLRSVISSEIKPNETTAVSVTFPVTVQINAKPWAQVFLDDGARHPLGQTPLSGVAVPIGAVLAFENPNYPTKSHRVTEKDTSIQVNFP